MNCKDQSNEIKEAFDAFRKRFRAPAEPRSPEYQEGWAYGYRRLIEGIPKIVPPYRLGTASADAWFAGNEEGRSAARQELKKRYEPEE